MERHDLLKILADFIIKKKRPHPLRVAIDGVDASGKTRFADELARTLEPFPHPVIRASVDDFHNPRQVRYQKGDLSPAGFYHDSFNYVALVNDLLEPLGPGGNLRYRPAAFDLANNAPHKVPYQTAPDDAILLVDGIFLMRPALVSYWDLTIYLDVDFSESQSRGIPRDAKHIGSLEEARRRYEKRYIPGQQIYLQEAHPLDKADILIDNNILEDPKIIRMPSNAHIW